MGAGGEAPPVKSEDVLILIGSSILLIMLIIQTWVTPINIEEGEGKEFTIKYDISAGDELTIEVEKGVVRPTVVLPNGDIIPSKSNVDKEWTFTAKEDGVHTFQVLALEDSVINYNLSRGIFLDFIMYPIGMIILGFGIWKKQAQKEPEPIEALLED